MAIVFFGTFDPFHENHFRLVDYVAKKYRPKKIAIIPNSDLSNRDGSGFKSGALPLYHRMQSIKIRMQNLEPVYNYLNNIVEVVSPGKIKTNWQGRQRLACQFGKDRGLPVLFVVIGLDSLISTLSRVDGGTGYHGENPLDSFILKILAIPRLGYDIPEMPEKYRGKITIEASYQEKHQISSTLIRQLVRNSLPIDATLCHPEVVNYLIGNDCYVERSIVIPEFAFTNKEGEEQFLNALKPVIVFMGSPGSGKTTLAQDLAATNNFLFISTGDLYRNEMEMASDHYHILQKFKHNPLDFKQALGQFIIYSIRKTILDVRPAHINGIVLEGFKAGDLSNWIKNFGKIDHLIYVKVDKGNLEARVKARNENRKGDLAFAHRIDSYFNIYEGEILVEIDTLFKSGEILSVCELNNNLSVDLTKEQLKLYLTNSPP